MHAHRSILRGDSSLVSEVAHCAFLQVHDPQSKPIFGLEGLKKRGHTPADLIGELQRGTLVFRKFPHPGVHRTRRGRSPALMIDQGVAENPIEPGHNLFASENAGPTIFAAVHEQLGLRLEPKRGPVEMVIVDRVPAEN